MQFSQPVVLALEKSINSLLALDKNVDPMLRSLSGRVICLHFKGLDARLYLLMHDTEIEVAGFYDGVIDTTLSGTPLAMASMSRNMQALFQGDVDIEGDLDVGKKMKRLLGEIKIDWEEQLSHVVGDTVAHQMGRMHQSLTHWFSRSGKNLSLDTGDYLKDELDLVIAEIDLDHFNSSVDNLRSAVDRFEARLSALEQSAEDDH